MWSPIWCKGREAQIYPILISFSQTLIFSSYFFSKTIVSFSIELKAIVIHPILHQILWTDVLQIEVILPFIWLFSLLCFLPYYKFILLHHFKPWNPITCNTYFRGFTVLEPIRLQSLISHPFFALSLFQIDVNRDKKTLEKRRGKKK